MSDEKLLQETLLVPFNGSIYEFAIPSFYDEIKLGMRERDIRREIDPSSGGAIEGLDQSTYILVRTAALFETLLRKGPKWVWSDGPEGKPVCNFRKWAPDKVEEAVAVGLEFQAELGRFRARGTANKEPAGAEAVAGKPVP